jgi:hypothetical protein
MPNEHAPSVGLRMINPGLSFSLSPGASQKLKLIRLPEEAENASELGQVDPATSESLCRSTSWLAAVAEVLAGPGSSNTQTPTPPLPAAPLPGIQPARAAGVVSQVVRRFDAAGAVCAAQRISSGNSNCTEDEGEGDEDGQEKKSSSIKAEAEVIKDSNGGEKIRICCRRHCRRDRHRGSR